VERLVTIEGGQNLQDRLHSLGQSRLTGDTNFSLNGEWMIPMGVKL